MKSYFCFNRILAGVIALLLMVTFFFACSKKTETASPNANQADNHAINAAADQAIVSGIYDDLFGIALEVGAKAGMNQAGRRAPVTAGKLGTCALPEVDDVSAGQWPKVMLIKFGSQCADETGRVRAGNIQVTYSNYFYYPNAVITIKPLSYTVNGIAVTGTEVITNLSTNSIYKYNAVLTDASLKLDTVTLSFTSNRTITQTDGLATLNDVTDDVFSIYGTDSLYYPNGLVAGISVAEGDALERKINCPWFSKGKALVTVGAITANVNYGNGVCDDSATIDLGDKVKSIVLPK
ncbi:hypothetical protein [Chitinophaga agri]|uniref:Fimbrillin family protein n=1 Tax=Chitinophaga agri TaxID=2703787 RepID=A0A6B9ZGP9_9BACT|nr:hypothetical protein [Chitinophaga agri]QHS61236.1 hypothetical protein GWR21_17005 [Chitinophaga agri]